MHLPPEVERLVPELLGRVGERRSVDRRAESLRIEALLLAGDPGHWLDYLRDRGEFVVELASMGEEGDPGDLARLAGIFRDQLVLIQVSIDLGPEDLALLDRLERLESR